MGKPVPAIGFIPGGMSTFFRSYGIESALRQAQAIPVSRDVAVAGGANIIQQYLQAGLLDEFQIHLVPILLGDGRRLFDNLGGEHVELESTRVVHSHRVTHLRFRVAR